MLALRHLACWVAPRRAPGILAAARSAMQADVSTIADKTTMERIEESIAGTVCLSESMLRGSSYRLRVGMRSTSAASAHMADFKVHLAHSAEQCETTSSLEAWQGSLSPCSMCKLDQRILEPQVEVKPSNVQLLSHGAAAAMAAAAEVGAVAVVAPADVAVDVLVVVDTAVSESDAVDVSVAAAANVEMAMAISLPAAAGGASMNVVGGQPFPSLEQHQAFQSGVHAACQLSYIALQSYSCGTYGVVVGGGGGGGGSRTAACARCRARCTESAAARTPKTFWAAVIVAQRCR